MTGERERASPAMLIFAGVVLVMLVSWSAAPANVSIIIGLFGGFVLVMSYIVFHHAGRRAAQRIMAAEPDADAGRIVKEALRIERRVPASQVLQQAIEACAEAGRVGQVLRIDPTEPRESIKPIDVPFEPLDLDQTDRRFQELNAGSGSSDGRRMNRTLRNINLNGGWLLLAFGVMEFIKSASEAWRQRRITFWLVIWTVFLLVILLIPRGGLPFYSKRLMAVPGGIVARVSPGWKRRCRLHLFRATDSLICISPQFRNHWTLVIADSSQLVVTGCTKAEAEFALQAWLSPLEPPQVDQLSDLE